VDRFFIHRAGKRQSSLKGAVGNFREVIPGMRTQVPFLTGSINPEISRIELDVDIFTSCAREVHDHHNVMGSFENVHRRAPRLLVKGATWTVDMEYFLEGFFELHFQGVIIDQIIDFNSVHRRTPVQRTLMP
jgi:hypothetical protein